MKYRSSTFILLFITLLAFGLRVYRLDAQSLWWDEMYTAMQANMTLPQLIESLLADRVHTPFYFLVMLVWGEIGRSAFILRYFSIVAGVMTIPLIYVTGKRLNGRSVGLTAAFLLAIAPFHVWFSQEARMYSLLTLSALAANYFLLRLLQREKLGDWAAYSLTLTVTLLTHFLGVLILIAHYTFFSFYYRYHCRQSPDRFKRWFISASVAGALYLGWFLAIFLISSFERAAIGWIAPASWYEPLLTFLSFSIGPGIDPANFLPYVAFSIYVIGLLAVGWFVSRNRQLPTAKWLSLRLLWMWLTVPLLLLTIVSIDLSIPNQRFIYMDRYIISLLPAFVLLAAWGLVALSCQSRAPRWLLPLLLAAVLLPTFFTWQNICCNADYARENWRAAFDQIEAVDLANDLFLSAPTQIVPYLYYGANRVDYVNLPRLLSCEYDDGELVSAHLRDQCIDDILQAEVASLPADVTHVWLLDSYHNNNAHGFPQARNRAAALAQPNLYEQWFEQNYTAVNQWHFTGVRLTLYDLTGNQ
jgi:mannosyltransferase